MKTTFGFSQFGSFNTPILAQKIGDIGLLCSAIGLSIIGIPLMMAEAGFAGFALPLIFTQAAKVLTAIGVFSKVITKLLGKTDAKGEPITTEKQLEIKGQAK